jgi:cysteinyl-tRNA synthetase
LAHEVQRLRDKDIQLAAQHGALLRKLGGVLGVLQDDPEIFLKFGSKNTAVDANKVDALIAARNKARQEKNWAEADRIRDELTAMSVVLEDGSGGTDWKIS